MTGPWRELGATILQDLAKGFSILGDFVDLLDLLSMIGSVLSAVLHVLEMLMCLF